MVPGCFSTDKQAVRIGIRTAAHVGEQVLGIPPGQLAPSLQHASSKPLSSKAFVSSANVVHDSLAGPHVAKAASSVCFVELITEYHFTSKPQSRWASAACCILLVHCIYIYLYDTYWCGLLSTLLILDSDGCPFRVSLFLEIRSWELGIFQ